MGLSIHYQGKLKDKSLIDDITNEVKDICVSFQWQYHLFDDELVKGICFSPPECEPLFFTFNKKGILYSPISLQYEIEPADIISTKTQFAGIEVHKVIIKLLKHVQAKYFSEFELTDEGNYWETDDEAVLQKQFDKYNFLMDAVENALKDFKADKNDTPKTLAERLEKFLKSRLSGKDSNLG